MKEYEYHYMVNSSSSIFILKSKLVFSKCEFDWLAEDCASDYHNEHGGFENKWPLTIHITDENGEKIKSFEVEREYDPVFNCVKEL